MNDHLDKLLLVDKPAGMSSFGVVARIRRVISQAIGKKAKVGHTGTLDPFATGLMIIVTGTECKNADKYSKLDKVYDATFCLGKISSTGDPEGEITEFDTNVPDRSEIERALTKFTGKITQTPPKYSAIKIAGVRAYKRARDGEDFVIPSRQVEIFSLELLDYNYPELSVRAHVSSGTYIRTLGEDIGDTLGTGAYCQSLRRTRVGEWSIEDAQTLDDFGVY